MKRAPRELYFLEKFTRQWPGRWGFSWAEITIVLILVILFPAHVAFWIMVFFWVGVFFAQDRLTRLVHTYSLKRINHHEGVIDDGSDTAR